MILQLFRAERLACTRAGSWIDDIEATPDTTESETVTIGSNRPFASTN